MNSTNTRGGETLTLRQLRPEEVRAWLPQLDAWLLPGASYNVEQTWPQVYRRDGSGVSLGIFEGQRLVSHLAMRRVEVQGAAGRFSAALIGSVATCESRRRQGLAGRLLATALQHCRANQVAAAVLWAERPELYEAQGFREEGSQWQLCLESPRPQAVGQGAEDGVRFATFADRAPLLNLHESKPHRVVRSREEMELVLSTPGMWTTVLEREGQLLAYACCGKGADLQGWWHDLGGSDADVATLLHGSMRLMESPAAMVMLPSFRRGVIAHLGIPVEDAIAVPMAMTLWLDPSARQEFFIDGLDSV